MSIVYSEVASGLLVTTPIGASRCPVGVVANVGGAPAAAAGRCRDERERDERGGERTHAS